MTIDAVVVVLVDSHRRGTCRSCGASLTWYRTPAGQWYPFDGRPQLLHVHRDETAVTRPWIGELSRHGLHFRTCEPRGHALPPGWRRL